MSIDYRDSGVDIDAGNETVRRIKALARRDALHRACFPASDSPSLVCSPLDPSVPDPVLVASADGVGTKSKVAFLAGVHDTIGVDLVNHCVNDILVQGARRQFFTPCSGQLSADVTDRHDERLPRYGCALLAARPKCPGFLMPKARTTLRASS